MKITDEMIEAATRVWFPHFDKLGDEEKDLMRGESRAALEAALAGKAVVPVDETWQPIETVPDGEFDLQYCNKYGPSNSPFRATHWRRVRPVIVSGPTVGEKP